MKSEFSCLNPDCPVGYHSFDTVKGYQNHLTHFPVCTEYNSRLLSLQSLGKHPTQLTATVPLPREEVLDLKHPATMKSFRPLAGDIEDEHNT